MVQGETPAFNTVGATKCRLYNTTTSSLLVLGSLTFNNTVASEVNSFLSGYFTITEVSVLELQQTFGNAVSFGLGAGTATLTTTDVGTNIRAEITLYRLY